MNIFKRISIIAAAIATAAVTSAGAFAQPYAVDSVDAADRQATIRTVATPKASVKPGVYEKNISVSLSCATSGARIFYTTDGSAPDIYSDIYDEPFRIKAEPGETEYLVIRAYAVKTGYEDSEEVEFEYTVSIPAQLEVTYMEINKEPTKTYYAKGEALSVAGGKIDVTFEDGSYQTINMTTSMIEGFNTNTAGEKELTVNYAGFKDTFTITVREGVNSGSSTGGSISSGGTSASDDLPEEAGEPSISGTTVRGWDKICDKLEQTAKRTSVIILMDGTITIPDTAIRAAAKNDLVLTFTNKGEVDWCLDTSAINKETIIPYMGIGIRTSAIYIPSVPLGTLAGEQMMKLHINSDNKLGADIVISLDKLYKGKFAGLYRYDPVANGMVLVDTVKIDNFGKAQLTPDISGDYVIVAGAETGIVGDLDNNMMVNALDAAKLMTMLVNGSLPDDAKYDVNYDGSVNALDASAILVKAIG